MLYLQKTCMLAEAFWGTRLDSSSWRFPGPVAGCQGVWGALTPTSSKASVCPCRPGLDLPPGGEDKPSPPPFPGKMGHFWLWASLTRGHLILAGFVLFILVNRAVYFQFVFLGMSAHFASLLFTLCKHLGLSKYAYKVPGTGLFCVWYFNGL